MTGQDQTYRIRLRVADQELEVEGDDTFVKEQFDDLASEYIDVSTAKVSTTGKEPTTLPATVDQEKPPTLPEIYQEANIQYKRDAALLVGWYLEMTQGQEDFTKSEIEDAAIDAKIELGKNLSRDIGHLVENGLLLEVDQRDKETAYYLTRSGEEYVIEEFDLPSEYSSYS